MDNAQMYGDYNMGIGFTLFAPEKSIEKIITLAKKGSISAIDAGVIANGPRQVVIQPLNIILSGESLQIR